MRLKTSQGKKVTYLLICIFVLLPGRHSAFWAYRSAWNLSVKNNNNNNKKVWNCPNDLIYITTKFIFLQARIFLFTIFVNYHNLFQLWQSFQLSQSSLLQSFLISFFYYNLGHYLYENKQTYKFHHLTHIFYFKTWQKILLTSYVSNLCFLLWIFFILYLIIFSLNKTSLNLSNSAAILTPFAILHSLPSIFFHRMHFWF